MQSPASLFLLMIAMLCLHHMLASVPLCLNNPRWLNMHCQGFSARRLGHAHVVASSQCKYILDVTSFRHPYHFPPACLQAQAGLHPAG
jgi:hypothetical protein